jgi:hypothetical protein
MRSVRCDVCGTKALMAASQCPKCGHQFSVRDGFGDMLPLSHCSTCNSDYPASIGSCKWCGTTPQRAPVAPHIWKGVGIVAFVGMAWGAWMVHDDKPTQAAATSQLQGLLKPDSSAVSSDSARPAETLASGNPVDSVARDTSTSVVLADTLAEPLLAGIVPSLDSITSVQSAGAIAEPEPAPAIDTTPVVPVAREAAREIAREPVRAPVPGPVRAHAPARKSVRPPLAAPASPRAATRAVARPPATVKAAPRVAPGVAVAPKASTRSRKAASRWTSTVARSWVVVRADPNKKSRIIASIGPNTRVQLGEARGEWRRIKTKGLAGWVEHRLFLARTSLAIRGSRLAAR